MSVYKFRGGDKVSSGKNNANNNLLTTRINHIHNHTGSGNGIKLPNDAFVENIDLTNTPAATAPIILNSDDTTKNDNLNADIIDGAHMVNNTKADINTDTDDDGYWDELSVADQSGITPYKAYRDADTAIELTINPTNKKSYMFDSNSTTYFQSLDSDTAMNVRCELTSHQKHLIDGSWRIENLTGNTITASVYVRPTLAGTDVLTDSTWKLVRTFTVVNGADNVREWAIPLEYSNYKAVTLYIDASPGDIANVRIKDFVVRGFIEHDDPQYRTSGINADLLNGMHPSNYLNILDLKYGYKEVIYDYSGNSTAFVKWFEAAFYTDDYVETITQSTPSDFANQQYNVSTDFGMSRIIAVIPSWDILEFLNDGSIDVYAALSNRPIGFTPNRWDFRVDYSEKWNYPTILTRIRIKFRVHWLIIGI